MPPDKPLLAKEFRSCPHSLSLIITASVLSFCEDSDIHRSELQQKAAFYAVSPYSETDSKTLGVGVVTGFLLQFLCFKTHFVNWKTNKIRLFIRLPMVPFPLDTNLNCGSITSPKMSNTISKNMLHGLVK